MVAILRKILVRPFQKINAIQMSCVAFRNTLIFQVVEMRVLRSTLKLEDLRSTLWQEDLRFTLRLEDLRFTRRLEDNYANQCTTEATVTKA
jgi:hypothetical protein